MIKIITYPATVRKLLTPDSRELELYRFFNTKQHLTPNAADVVLVQAVEDTYFFGLFGQIISSLREQQSIRVEQFVLNSFRLGESSSVLNFFLYRFINWLLGRKWVGLYNSFCDRVGYRSTGMQFPIADVIDIYRAFVCWRSISTKDALISLVIDGVPVGDLINDTYLRYKPAPTVNLADAYLWLVIWQAYRDVRRAKNYFPRIKPKLYLTTYSTYIQHGIAVRVALQCGVRVFSFGNRQEFAKELSIGDWMHTKNPDNYSNEFPRLGNSEQKIVEANAALTTRMAGTIDSATAYMKKSAYTESDSPVPNVRGALVIFLHDFFDSPHVYRGMVFPDFWEWICFTIETLEILNICFFIKPHPNQIDLSDGVLTKLAQRYPSVSIILPNITNKQLVEAGMVCAVTVYGTVAHEMAYLGVPTIACGDHPHVSFDFCQTAKTKDEYADLLRQYAEIRFDKLVMHRQSLIFYYMHNFNLSVGEKSLMDVVSALRNAHNNPTIEQPGSVKLLESISKLPAFNAYISRLM
jgi:hypothetical protein